MVLVKRLFIYLTTLSAMFLTEHFSKQIIPITLLLNMEPNRLSRTIPISYQQILEYMYNAQREPKYTTDIICQCLWYNKHIKINDGICFNNGMSDKQINNINDIINKNDVIMKNSTKRHFKLHTNIMFINSIISFIPKTWNT